MIHRFIIIFYTILLTIKIKTVYTFQMNSLQNERKLQLTVDVHIWMTSQKAAVHQNHRVFLSNLKIICIVCSKYWIHKILVLFAVIIHIYIVLYKQTINTEDLHVFSFLYISLLCIFYFICLLRFICSYR